MNHPVLKRICALMTVLVLITGLLSVAALADADMRRAVVGADLTEEQVLQVYADFGLRRGDVPELRLTNAEEHLALEGYVDQAVIGTKAMSCVYLELLPQGSGVNVTTKNISWFTPEMYVNALTTAGLTDARVDVAAPFPVSGTAALAGIYKAYEDMTGQTLDDLLKTVSTQELTTTGELADEIGSEGSTSIINELKGMLGETAKMTDDEVRSLIRKIASEYKVRLTDTQVEQLLDLCRSMEKLDTNSLAKRVEDLQNTLEKVSEAKDQVVGFMQTIRNAIESIRNFFSRVKEIFGGR